MYSVCPRWPFDIRLEPPLFTDVYRFVARAGVLEYSRQIRTVTVFTLHESRCNRSFVSAPGYTLRRVSHVVCRALCALLNAFVERNNTG